MNIIPTNEQVALIQEASKGSNLCVRAFAGAAKSTSCILIAEAIQKPSLYLAFMKNNAEEAKGKFPSHVDCMTVNSLAWRAVIKRKGTLYDKKLKPFFNYQDIPDIYPGSEDANMEAKVLVITIIKEYCQSAMKEISDFISYWEKLSDRELTSGLKSTIYAFWKAVSDENNPVGMTHDVYLKIYQLRKPRLAYSIIYLDEAQDSSPVILDIVFNQLQYDTQVILVGDSYQSIYEWRGAIDAFDQVPKGFVNMYLTESFRFTPEIAALATKLTGISGNNKEVIGKREPTLREPNSTAVIVRNNVTMLDYLLRAEEEEQKVFCLTNLSELWSKLYHIQALIFNSEPKFPDKELKQYKTFKELNKAAENMAELAKLINLTSMLSQREGGLHTSINKIKSVIVDDASKADFSLTTCHRAKGLEWDNVILANDMLFINEKNGETLIGALKNNQTLNLLYVAVTRAKYKVELPPLVWHVIENYKELREEWNGLDEAESELTHRRNHG